jgi:hypothetical protein
MTSSKDWDIPHGIWAVLLSWGLGVLLIAGLLSFWIWKNEQDQEREEARLQVEQDRAMCAIVRAFVEAPEPPPGPEGERSRYFRKLMADYRAALHCQELEAGVSPARDRDRD